MTDIRDIPQAEREKFINEDVLAKLPPHQAELVKRTMVSEEWRQAETAVRLDELEKEVTKLRPLKQRAEEAFAERDKARERADAAEKAQAAAERKAEREKFARIGVEEELEELKQQIVQLQQQPSRLAKLREELGL